MENNINKIEKIKRSYEEKEESDFERLLKLDKNVKRKANVFSYILGSVSALILGFGMSLSMKVIFDMMPLGIVIGLFGIGMCILNFFINRKMVKKNKDKHREEILELCNSLKNDTL